MNHSAGTAAWLLNRGKDYNNYLEMPLKEHYKFACELQFNIVWNTVKSTHKVIDFALGENFAISTDKLVCYYFDISTWYKWQLRMWVCNSVELHDPSYWFNGLGGLFGDEELEDKLVDMDTESEDAESNSTSLYSLYNNIDRL